MGCWWSVSPTSVRELIKLMEKLILRWALAGAFHVDAIVVGRHAIGGALLNSRLQPQPTTSSLQFDAIRATIATFPE